MAEEYILIDIHENNAIVAISKTIEIINSRGGTVFISNRLGIEKGNVNGYNKTRECQDGCQ